MMKKWRFIIIALIAVLIALEIIQFLKISALHAPQKDDFLPMVYENQIYHSSSTDGLDIICPTFHTELIRRRINDCPVLVFRYSGLSCKGCVQSCINELRRQYQDYIENKKILIVVSDMVSERVPENALLLKSEETLGYDLEDTRVPHFFVYDHQIKHTFVPDQTDMNGLKVYLSTIAGRYGI
ncbi:MAG: hypothetical protein IJP77_05270 [Bacteroidales bacterium]|nr:hypothetical protein [Bacteroidales bacterium]